MAKRARTNELPADVLAILERFAADQPEPIEALPAVVAQAKELRDSISGDFWTDEHEAVYGFPCTDDARDFLPSPDEMTDVEWVRWLADYRKAEAGDAVDWPGPFYAGDGIHISRTSWGMGVTRWKRRAS